MWKVYSCWGEKNSESTTKPNYYKVYSALQTLETFFSTLRFWYKHAGTATRGLGAKIWWQRGLITKSNVVLSDLLIFFGIKYFQMCYLWGYHYLYDS